MKNAPKTSPITSNTQLTDLGLSTRLSDNHAKFLQRAYNLTWNIEDARDLRQEVQTRARANRDRFTPWTNLWGRLHTVMVNTHTDMFRKNQKKRTIEFNAYPSAGSSHNEWPATILWEQLYGILNRFKRTKVKEIMDLLSQGYKYEDIAEELQMPRWTVAATITKARRVIAARLNK